MILTEVEKLLRETIGLNVESVGSSVVQYALKQRLAATRLADPADYWRLLTGSPAERQELVNAVVIPETWFFRDREAFAAMVRHARSHRRPLHPVRILSLPCSTGEEAYSMAMAMLDAGFSAGDFAIDAIDVSTRNIAEAERAVYGRNSFRGDDLAFRARHFSAVEGGYSPNAQVVKPVRFSAGNLFDPAATDGPGSYDIVFCRNLLIYFDRTLQERALLRLRQLLVPDGMLVVGPAESSLPVLCGFVSAQMPMAFAFLKRETPADSTAAPLPAVAKPRRLPARAERPPTPMAAAPAGRTPPAPPPAPPPEAATETGAEAASLAALEQAANAGRLGEMRAAAAAHIARFGPSTDVHYLLGLACDAGGLQAAAIEHYRKALYLAPDHRETLAHLALLLQRRGDTAGAKVLSDRLGRIERSSRR